MKTEGPYYQHDCSNCQYIASTHGQHGLSDWYICERKDQQLFSFSIIRRDTDEGADYSSWPSFMLLDPKYSVGVDNQRRKALVESHIMANAMLAIHKAKQT